MTFRKFAAAAAVVGFAFVSFGYDSTSYAGRDYLIAQWDGIDNSLDADSNPVHDENATAWKDLTGAGHDIAGLTDYGSFQPDMYKKTASSVNKPSQKFGLTALTFEVVIDVSSYTSGWIVPLSTKDTLFITLQKKNGKLQMFYGSNRSNPYSGLEVDWPEGDRILLSCSTDKVIFLNGEKVESNYGNYWGTNDDNCFGGSSSAHTSGNTKDYGVCAIRMYDAILSDADRAFNATVDRARFIDKTNSDVLLVKGDPIDVGTAVPAYGLAKGYSAGQTVDCSVDKVWTNAEGTVAAICTGYAMTANGEPYAGGTFGPEDDSAFSYVHPDSPDGAQLTWTFEMEYLATVDLAEAAGCTVAPSSVWAKPGETVTLTATCAAGRAVTCWRGVDGTASGDTFTFRMPNAPVTVKPVSGGVYYVATNGDDGAAGDADHPFATIGHALQAVQEDGSGSVYVGPGEYPVEDQLVIDSPNPIRLESLEGAGKTFVVRTKNPPQTNPYTLSISAASTGAFVGGFTFTQKGTADYGHVVFVGAGEVSHCAVVDTHFDCWCAKVLAGGRITDTDFIGNVQMTRYNDPFMTVSGGTLERCRFLRNLTDYNRYGEMVRLTEGGLLRNTLVACNTNKADNVAGVTVIDAASRVENCSIVGNVSLGSNAPVGITGGRNNNAGLTYNEVKGTVVNTIIFGNRNATGVYDAYTGTYDHCASAQELSGKSNQRLAAIDFDADWRVQSGPTVDAGKELDWMATGLDLEGKDRVINGVPDLGCYEFLPTGELRASVQVDRTDTVGTGDFLLTASVSGLASDLQNLAYAWTVACDGQTVATGDKDKLALENLGVGAYTVALTVTSGTGKTATWDEGKDLVVVHPQTVFVAVDSTPKFPYASPATAASDLDMALERIQDGMTVLIGPGTYADKPTPQVGKAVTIRSTEGRDRTFFTHSELDLTLLKLANPLASFSGVTFTQTVLGAYCGRAIVLESGVLFDCVVRDCATMNSAIANVSGGAVVSNCVFTCNRTTRNVSHVYLKDGLIDNCEFTRTSGSDERYGAALTLEGASTVRDSLFAFNTNTLCAAAIRVMGGTIENCTIVSNVVTERSTVAAGLGRGSAGDDLTAATTTIRNSIICGNFGPGGETNITSRPKVEVSYTLSHPIYPTGAGNLGGDPKFRNARNFRLKSSSPAVDRGLYQGWMDGAVDLDGKPRIYINPTTGEGTVDLGCYESKPVGMLLLVR